MENWHLVLGVREAWGQELPFVLSPHDRRHHLYAIGKSGTGKTTLLRNLILQDIIAGHGVGVIDPHGDLISELLDHIPRHRIEDVTYFNPADMEYPVGFNLISQTPPDSRHLIASGIVGVFKSTWPNFWGPRTEYILYATVAALLDCDNFSAGDKYIEDCAAQTVSLYQPVKGQALDCGRCVKSADGSRILAWHPDRLARNSVDGGRIIYLLDTEKIKALKFPTVRFESDPQGKFMLNIMFGQSKYYVDALSENTKSGLREKVRRGEYPGPAPIGYLNDYRTKKIIVDRERAAIVKEAFERYATGNETQQTLRKFFGEHKIYSRTGKLLGNTTVANLLTNPMYYGHFRYRGEVYEGKHEPLISKKLFDDVQDVINTRWRYSPKENHIQPKAFVGLLHCAGCGGGVTAEVQKGHTYYRCTKKNKTGKCLQPYIREEVLDAQITELLKPYSMPSDWADYMLSRVKQEKKQIAQSAAQLVAQKRDEIEKINLRLQRLLDSFLDELIDRETFTAEKAKLMSRKKTLEEEKTSLMAGRADWLEPFQNWILSARNAGEIALADSLPQKRVLALEVFGSNLVLDCKKARGSCVKPWSALVEFSRTGGMVRGAGFEPAKASFTTLLASGANDVSLPFIARRITRESFYLQVFYCK